MTTVSAPAFVAFDLGATSGRAVLGRLDDDRLTLEEVHRFPNGPVCVSDSLFWDILRLWDEMGRGLALAAKAAGGNLAGIGVGEVHRGDVVALAALELALGQRPVRPVRPVHDGDLGPLGRRPDEHGPRRLDACVHGVTLRRSRRCSSRASFQT